MQGLGQAGEDGGDGRALLELGAVHAPLAGLGEGVECGQDTGEQQAEGDVRPKDDAQREHEAQAAGEHGHDAFGEEHVDRIDVVQQARACLARRMGRVIAGGKARELGRHAAAQHVHEMLPQRDDGAALPAFGEVGGNAQREIKEAGCEHSLACRQPIDEAAEQQRWQLGCGGRERDEQQHGEAAAPILPYVFG